jgi:pimeloyl-ACP methyl ester carboxylesterase
MIIKTSSFQLAVYAQGDPAASKLALVLPGKLDTKDYPHLRSHVEALARQGFFALAFDPPGTWESPGGIELYTMSNYLKAVHEVIEYYGHKATFVMGHSRGGSIAMLAAITHPAVQSFAAVMSWASFSPQDHGGYPDEEWRALGYKKIRRALPVGNDIQRREFELPYSFLEDQMKYSMLADLQKLVKPKLFFAGSQDTVVLPAVVKQAYESAAEPKKLVRLDTEHDYRLNPGIIRHVNDEIRAWLSQYWQ